ncbi:MAG TPA: TonB-dependent receptor, partial [Patescibacteria group bacterium]|nr:TonB-dependent receptor [Patescibacteria group bacterium]
TSTEPDKKSFAFDMFPSEFLENATVTKSFTPDLPGNFAGGLVQLNTVDFPQGFGIKVSASSSYNSNTTFQSGEFNSYQGGANDWIGVDDGTRAMPGGMPASRDDMNALLRSIRNADNTAQREQWMAMGQSFNTTVWNRQQLTANPNSGFGLSFSNIFNIADNDLGVIASANYGNSYSINRIERNGIMGDRSFLFTGVGSQATRSVSLGGLLNLAYKIGAHSSISFKNVFNRSSDDETITLAKVDSIQRRDLQLSSFEFVSKELLTSQLGGEHTLPQDFFMGGTLLDWRLGYSRSTRDQPDFRRLRYSRELGIEDEPFRADIQPTAQGDGTSVGRFFSELNESGLGGGVNASIPVGSLKFKVGGLLEQKDRTFRARSFTIIQSQAVVPNQDFTVDLAQSPDSLFRAENFRLDGLGISEDSKRSDMYDASENLSAAFLMLDAPFQLGGLDFRFVGGARFENSTQRIFNTASVDNRPVDANLTTNDILPSVNLIYRATEDMNIRMSASQTLTRPSLREFAPFEFYDFQTQARIGGNPNLNRALIHNYDLRFEIFPNIGEVVSASLFYKNFKNAIEETIKPTGGGEIARTFDNAQGDAKNYGVELEFRKSLGFLSEYFSNFIISTNLALVNSEISVMQGGVEDKRQMWGQSPYTLNASLFFIEPNFKTAFSLGYNTYGRRIIQVAQQGTPDQPTYNFEDPHVYELARDVIDFSIVQPIADVIEAKFVVRDLLNQPLIWEQGGARIASNLRGRNFSISLGYRLQ